MKKFLSIILAGMLALSVASCGSKSTTSTTTTTSDDTATADSDLKYITDKGEMIIGYTIINPLNYMDGDTLTGFETEFATAVCEKLGVKPKFQEINWDSKEVELSSKAIDCIWNGMTITDDRKTNMSVTIPYMENKQVLVVKQENANKYKESVNGAKVAAESGSAGEETVNADEFFKTAEFTAVDSQAKALMDVKAGVSDVAVIDYIMALGSTGEDTDYADLTLVDKGFEAEEYGAAFRKGSDVTAKVDEAIKELASDGTLKTIADKYKLTDSLLVK